MKGEDWSLLHTHPPHTHTLSLSHLTVSCRAIFKTQCSVFASWQGNAVPREAPDDISFPAFLSRLSPTPTLRTALFRGFCSLCTCHWFFSKTPLSACDLGNGPFLFFLWDIGPAAFSLPLLSGPGRAQSPHPGLPANLAWRILPPLSWVPYNPIYLSLSSHALILAGSSCSSSFLEKGCVKGESLWSHAHLWKCL